MLPFFCITCHFLPPFRASCLICALSLKLHASLNITYFFSLWSSPSIICHPGALYLIPTSFYLLLLRPTYMIELSSLTGTPVSCLISSYNFSTFLRTMVLCQRLDLQLYFNMLYPHLSSFVSSWGLILLDDFSYHKYFRLASHHLLLVLWFAGSDLVFLLYHQYCWYLSASLCYYSE